MLIDQQNFHFKLGSVKVRDKLCPNSFYFKDLPCKTLLNIKPQGDQERNQSLYSSIHTYNLL